MAFWGEDEEVVEQRFIDNCVNKLLEAKVKKALEAKNLDETINKCINKAISGISNADIALKIDILLTDIIKKNILSLLGFSTDRYSSSGKYEIDHCNGRSGNSKVGLFITDSSNKLLQELLEKHLKAAIKTPEFEKELSKYAPMFKKEIKDKIEWGLRDHKGEFVDSFIEKIVNETKEKIQEPKKQKVKNEIKNDQSEIAPIS